jgi:Zn-finger nucleic acid-binding protein
LRDAPTKMRCPRCAAVLRVTVHAGTALESCPSCHAVFLDRDDPLQIEAWRRARPRGPASPPTLKHPPDEPEPGQDTAVSAEAHTALVLLVSRALQRAFCWDLPVDRA